MNPRRHRAFAFAPALAALSAVAALPTACADAPSGEGAPSTGAAASANATPSATAAGAAGPLALRSPDQATFWARLQALCGQSFEGRLDLAPPDDAWWDAARIVMEVRACDDEEVRIPLHIDDNRSRTWIVTRTAEGLRLKHDHRLADGSPDTANTNYGGDTALPGSEWRQEFPADAYSVARVPARASQLWYVEIRPGDAFVYGLRREATGLRYHVEFDLTTPVEAPPAPWGWEDGPEAAARPAPATAVAAPAPLGPEQEAFWARLEAHCGRAYEGEVSDATPYYRDGVVGRRAVIHFFDCAQDRLHIPFHLDDDRSRNWILTRSAGTIRLKHDHRHADGTEEEISQYGGDAPIPGLPTRQIFPADAHTASILPQRADNFWFFDFVDDETLEYGVHWPAAGHSVRFAFDLSRPVEAPPAPWGY